MQIRNEQSAPIDAFATLGPPFALAVATWWFVGCLMLKTEGLASESASYPVLSGVGIALQEAGGDLVIGTVVANSPAEESGMLREGCRVVSVEIDGKRTSLEGVSVGDAASLIRGPVGTDIVLTVELPDDHGTKRVPLRRAPLEIAGISAFTYEDFIGKPLPEFDPDQR